MTSVVDQSSFGGSLQQQLTQQQQHRGSSNGSNTNTHSSTKLPALTTPGDFPTSNSNATTVNHHQGGGQQHRMSKLPTAPSSVATSTNSSMSSIHHQHVQPYHHNPQQQLHINTSSSSHLSTSFPHHTHYLPPVTLATFPDHRLLNENAARHLQTVSSSSSASTSSHHTISNNISNRKMSFTSAGAGVSASSSAHSTKYPSSSSSAAAILSFEAYEDTFESTESDEYGPEIIEFMKELEVKIGSFSIHFIDTKSKPFIAEQPVNSDENASESLIHGFAKGDIVEAAQNLGDLAH
jgi:hypothetical protein